ncbi:efflux transporter outer membrane subunit [Paraburkholderia sp. BL27I4N3]|uniref:efflux transporter outer membrane subunit n=1 Tax=Paraburkholderia sp. BL27I4N3 TaxID=1938805 RepID=UPI000E28479E|nr:efflux transporter outer membrane subunit [Paraburkholderia sp. BL27I4N3]
MADRHSLIAGCRQLLAFLLAGVLCACTGSLKLNEPTQLPERFYEATRAPSEGAVSISDAQLAQWWTQYDDPVLSDLIGRALERSYDIAIAATRIDQARAGVVAARSQLLPSVGAGVEGGAYHGGPVALEFQELLGVNDLNASYWRAGLQTQWEIDVFGRGRARLAAAHALTSAAAGDAQAVRLSIIATVADLYMTYRGLQQQRALLVQSHQIAADFVVIAERSFTAGVTLSTDTDVARAGLAQVQARQQDVEAAISGARLAIENLCVVAPGSLKDELESNSALPKLLPDITPGQPVDLLMRRPDLIAARERLLASVKQSDVARLNYWPTVSLSGLLARNGWMLAGQNLGASTFWLFGAALSLPLIDFGARESQVQASDAQAQQALLAYEKAASEALYDVEQALARLKQRQQLLAARNEEVSRRQEVLRKTTQQYKVGDLGRVDIDQARVALLESQTALVREEVELVRSQVALFRAMGGGWQVAGTTTEVSPAQ